MNQTPEHNARMAKLTFASVYPHYLSKVERKGRTKQELQQVIQWLTGIYSGEMKPVNLVEREPVVDKYTGG